MLQRNPVKGSSRPSAVPCAPTTRTDRLHHVSAGTVISIVANHERFIVDKLASKLEIPILEAHLADGELLLGPEPAEATNRAKMTLKADRAARQQADASLAGPSSAASAKSGTAEAVNQSSSNPVGRDARAEAAVSKTVAGSSAGTSGAADNQPLKQGTRPLPERNASAARAAKPRKSSRDSQKELQDLQHQLDEGRGPASPQIQKMLRSLLADKTFTAPDANDDDGDDDDEDDVGEGQGPSSRAATAQQTSGRRSSSSSSLDIRQELSKELEELRRERRSRAEARNAKKKPDERPAGRRSKSSSPP